MKFFDNLTKPDSKFSFLHFTVEDVYSAILSLNNSQCLDVYSMNAKILKAASVFICEPLAHIFNSCIDSKLFPDAFKHIKIIPVFKKGNKFDYGNYRPICIIPTVSKIFEILINKQIYRYFEDNKLFTKNQFGFRICHNTVDAVMSFIKRSLDGIENKCSVSSYFFDFTKAFDTVSHSTLLHKLRFYGFDYNSVELLSSYLNDRYHTVTFKGISSQFKLMKHGVPQGSIIGPVLFLIYINDLPKYIGQNYLETYMFADDLAVNLVQPDNDDLSTIDIDDITAKILTWCNANKLSLNSNKTESLQFSLNRRCRTDNAVKFLGIYLDSSMSWQKHINYVASKLRRSLFMLRILKNNISLESLMTVYYGYIHSHINYGIILWGNHASSRSIFILQKRALRIIYGVPPRTSCKPLFIQSGILTLPSMFVLASLLYVKNNIENFTVCTNLHNYPTRNNLNLYIDRCKYSTTQNSFVIISLKLFNSVPLNIRELSLETFKRRVRETLKTVPLYSVDEFYHVQW